MQVSYGRLQAYAGMGFLSFAMIVMGSPIGNTGTWFGSMVRGSGSSSAITMTRMRTKTINPEPDDDSTTKAEQFRLCHFCRSAICPDQRVERIARSRCSAVCCGLALGSLK